MSGNKEVLGLFLPALLTAKYAKPYSHKLNFQNSEFLFILLKHYLLKKKMSIKIN